MIKNKIVAIDFDGTITENLPFPQVANIRDEAKIYIPKLYQLGCKLVLWTARKEPYYSECINILKEHNLLKYFSFDYDTGYSGKLIADFYLDDRSCLEEFNWKNWYTFIEERIK